MSMPNQSYTVRRLGTGDLDAYNRLLRYAVQVTEADLAESGWRADEIKQSKFPVLERADVLGCFDGDDLVSQIAVYPLKMNIYGTATHVGFVTSVCTYPEYTGQGIMKRLMRQSLDHMRERRQPFALLFPYSIPLYRRFGYEIISNKISYTVKDRQVPTEPRTSGYVRRVPWTSRDFTELHTRFASVTHGCLYRSRLAWEEYWRWDEDDTVVAVYYAASGEARGYMVYLIKEDVMHIKEMICLDREAHEGLWGYVRAHDSMIDEVRGNTYNGEPIAFELDDGDIREVIRPYIMGRIVDAEQFFAGYACDPAEDGLRVAFEIEDGFLEYNNRSLTVRFAHGVCTLTDGAPDCTVRLTIATLTTLLLGYKTAVQLWRLGRIGAELPVAARLDDALLHEAPYISDYI